MHTLISGGRVVTNDWVLFEDAPAGTASTRIIVPATYALAHADALRSRGGEVGIWLACDSEPEEFTPLLDWIALIAIRFPAMNDGRGLSLAVLLRTRYAFRGELRAIGEVHEDVLHYMQRCGFDSFELPEGHDPTIALAAIKSLDDFYQGSVIDPRPAYRRVGRGIGKP